MSRMLPKEFRQLLRDPRSKRMLFVGPLVQLVIFGYAVTTDVRHVRTLVADHDRTAASRELVDALSASGYFDVVQRAERPTEIVDALDHGRVLMTLEIPRGFAADVAAGREADVQLLVDGSTANTANVALGYANQIISRWGLRQGAEVAARAGVTRAGGGVDFRTRAWFNQNLESRIYNVPAVMGNIVMMMALLLTSLAVVREREIGTLEQLMVSPLRPVELIVGKTLPAVVVAFLDMVIITTVSLIWFDIPFRGSFVLLAVSSLCYILTGLGVGLLISTVSNTQQEAFMTMFLFFLPAMMLSGMMFPVENMPRSLQYLTLLDPIRHYLVIVRGVFLRGSGWGVLMPQIAVLTVIGVGILGFATTRFRKTTA
ncbi:MAG: ABC transporter permease [Gemmatimonadetes bacterium]|nr:ABC transporter permease [Gemmatimonadota bacterium]